MASRSFRRALRRPAPKQLAIVALVPITIFTLVALSAAFFLGAGESVERLEKHIKRKQAFLRKKRAGELPKGARLYPRKKKK